jgi:cytochrome P450
MLLPDIAVDEELRSDAAKRNKSQYGVWDPEDIGQFKPERWLKVKNTDSDGNQKQVEFYPNAGPLLNFGAVPRACFGKRLVYLELQVTFALLVWSFELSEMGGDLNVMDETISMTRGPRLCYIQPKVVSPNPVPI